MSSRFMVTEDLLKSEIKSVTYTVVPGTTVTICHILLKNGFSVSGDEACVDPANFNKELGEKYAYEKAFNNLWPLFGFLTKQRMYEEEMRVERMARACHQVNKAYCEGIGDFTQKPWEQAEEWQRESARLGVRARLEQELTPEEQHNLWMRHKLANGWKFGERKDDIAKTHPCIVPYSMLPAQQKVKDLLFGAVVEAMKDY